MALQAAVIITGERLRDGEMNDASAVRQRGCIMMRAERGEDGAMNSCGR